MMRLLSAQLPFWARPGNPVLRYELGKAQRSSARTRYLRALTIVIIGILVLLIGYVSAVEEVAPETLDTLPLTEAMLTVLYWPVLVMQIVLVVGAITLTANTVDDEKRRQTWDNLRATESGAAMAFRARWASVFYRLRGLLGVVLAARVVFIFGILYDLTAFRGGYLDRLINGIRPELSTPIAVILLSFFMASTLLLPLTGVGLDAALGLLCSTLVKQRTYNVIVQILLILLRVGGILALVVGVRQFYAGELAAFGSESGYWALMSANGIIGDWGLRFLQLGSYSQLWAALPFGIFLSVVLMFGSLLQALFADVVLSVAIRRAEKRE